MFFFFFQAEDGIRDYKVTGVQTCALPIFFIGEPYATMVRAVTGWDVTVDELEQVGERVINLERLFNVREGVRRAQDVLPWRVMHEPIPDGPSAGMHCPPD